MTPERKVVDPAILGIEGDITRPETAERILGTAAEHFGRPICSTPSAGVGDATSDRVVPTAAIRHALRALASETGPLAGPRGVMRGVKLVRPLVAQAHEVLRERLEAGGSVEAYLRGRTRLADSAVVGLLHIASVSTRLRGNNMVVPLAAVAVGGYGRSELAPGSDLDLLFLLPENSQSRAGAVAAATETCIKAVVAGLWDLGFVLDHTARSSRECLALARDEPAVLASLLDRRFLWGGFGLFAALDADLAGLFSGPHAARWRGAVGTALLSGAGDALNKAQTPENEPDVKRGPGGLRDLQRALSVNTLASGRPEAIAEPALVEAHRFLWLVRCHLHLLVGRAEDRLSSAPARRCCCGTRGARLVRQHWQDRRRTSSKK